MGIYHTTNPVAIDNLVYSLDFGNRRSYSGSGITALDISTSGFSATATNSPTFTTTNKGEFNFVKTTGTRFHSHGTYALSGAKSVFAWIYPSTMTIQAGFQRIMVWMTTATTNEQFSLAVGNELADVTLFYPASTPTGLTNNAADVTTSGAGFPISNWYHVGFALPGSGSTVIQYVNGIGLTGRAAAFGFGYPASFTGVFIGARSDSNTFDYNGKIASVQVYNKRLSDAEVVKLYNSQKGRFGL
jgi:Concanavalin A-like lectin/glucanases superfamily